MLRLLIILSVIAVALLRGGSLHNFAAVRLRWLPLVFGGLTLQLLIFTPFREESLISVATPWLYIISMLMLAAWAAVNRHIPGIAFMATGLLLNLTVIAANGGYMPVLSEAIRTAGMPVSYGIDGRHNSLATFATGGVHLWLLADIIPIPFAGVFSIGDVLLTLGVAICCYCIIRPAPILAPGST